MKIGIIADTHGNLAGWNRAMEIGLGDADIIIHCGDLLYHGPKFKPVEGYDPMGLANAINASTVPVLVGRGNADSDVDQLVLNVPIQQPYLFVQIEGMRILASHGHLCPHAELVRLARQWQVDLLLTAHTHVPSISGHGSLTHINPGSVTYAAPGEILKQPTCAALVCGRPVFYDLNTGEETKLT